MVYVCQAIYEKPQDHPSIEDEVTPWLQKMHALVVGPGLGRSFSLMSPAKIIVNKAIELGLPLVIDADGIYLISCDPELVRGEKGNTGLSWSLRYLKVMCSSDEKNCRFRLSQLRLNP